MNSMMSVALRAFNRMMYKMGHILTLAASLTLWFGIYSMVSSGPSNPIMAAKSISVESDMPANSHYVSNDDTQRDEQTLMQEAADNT